MLKKCVKCGRFFDAEDSDICTACKHSNIKFKSSGDVERDKYTATREVVYDNPDISPQGIIEVLEDMGISISHREIMRYVDEGKLTLSNIKAGKHCENCGTRITGGKLCERCLVKKDLERKAESQKADTGSHMRMHTKKD